MKRERIMLFNKQSKLAWALGIICIVSIMLIIQQLYYQSTHFWANTSITGIDVSHLTYQEAVHKIERHHSAPSYTIIDPQSKKVVYSKNFNEIKTTNYEAQLKNRLSEQKHSLWWSINHSTKKFDSLTLYKDHDLASAVKKDQPSLTSHLEKINLSRTLPQDGKVIIQDSKVSVVPSQSGNQISVKKTVNQVSEQLTHNSKKQVQVTAPLLSKAWDGKKTAKKLQSELKQQFTYHANKHQITAKVSDLVKNGTISKNDVSIDLKPAYQFIKRFNQKYTLSGAKTLTFKTVQGKEISFNNSEGTWGWSLDPSSEAQKLVQSLVAGKNDVTAQKIKQSNQSVNQKNWNKKVANSDHIEIDLTHERLYLVHQQSVVQQTKINTGSPKINIATPTGVYFIKFKIAPITMRGYEKNGEPYKSYVPQADNLTDDGIFIHSAPWVKDSVFGNPSQRYDHGSNGCINVPPKAMTELYGKTVVNEPVVIYGQG
jgi:hypothetical protein